MQQRKIRKKGKERSKKEKRKERKRKKELYTQVYYHTIHPMNVPSKTSVILHMCANVAPLAQVCTTSIKFGLKELR